MSTVVSCTCGARIKLPEGRLEPGFSLSPVQGRVARRRRKPRSSPPPWPVPPRPGGEPAHSVKRPFVPVRPRIICPALLIEVHHRECWSDVGGCATYGCENAPQADKSAPVETPRSAWGETKKCPACGEKIKSIACAPSLLRHRIRHRRSAEPERSEPTGQEGRAAAIDSHPGCRPVRSRDRRLCRADHRGCCDGVRTDACVMSSSRPGQAIWSWPIPRWGSPTLYSILMVLFVLFSLASR